MKWHLLNNYIFLFIIYLSICNKCDAQDYCGTNEYHKHLLRTDSNYNKAFNSLQNQIIELQDQPSISELKNKNYKIPIVVHIIHRGEPYGQGSNISDSVVYSAIQGLNDRFNNVIGNGQDLEIEFCLALRDPDGKKTNGINRVNGNVVNNFYSEGVTYDNLINVQNLSRWPLLDYYNIWVAFSVNISGRAAGATYPMDPPYKYDGTIISTQLMSYKSEVLTHELGHALFLYHTFEGDDDGTCPKNDYCNAQGDKICDTPPYRRENCKLDSCTSEGIWANSKFNYMSYCTLPVDSALFTAGQKDRIYSTLGVFPRSALLNSQSCIPCEQLIFQLNQSKACNNGIIYLNSTYILGATYHWSGPNGFESNTNYTYFLYEGKMNEGFYKCEATILGCPSKFVDSVYIRLLHNPVVKVDSVVDISCFGKADGRINIQVSSGQPPYYYYWSNKSSLQNQNNLSSGKYSVTVTDYNGCTSSIIQEIVEPSLISSLKNFMICEGDSILLGGIYRKFEGEYVYTIKHNDECDTLIIAQLSTYPRSDELKIDLFQNVIKSNYTQGNQWYFNDTIIQGETSDSIIVSKEGQYYDIVNDVNGCRLKSNTVNYNILDIKSIPADLEGLNIYPNPGKEMVTIQIPKYFRIPFYFELINLNGIVIFEKNINSNNFIIDLCAIHEGLYVAQFSNKCGQKIRNRIFIEK